MGFLEKWSPSTDLERLRHEFLRLGHSSSHPKASGEHQRDEQSDCRVDCRSSG